MAIEKGYGISPKTKITVRLFNKGKRADGSEWCNIIYSDSIKTANGYKNLGEYIIWVENTDIIASINKLSIIQVEKINNIWFTSNTYKNNQGVNVNKTSLNLNAVIKLFEPEQNTFSNTNANNYNGQVETQDYDNQELDLPDFDLPF